MTNSDRPAQMTPEQRDAYWREQARREADERGVSVERLAEVLDDC